jgi:hypothetical protein
MLIEDVLENALDLGSLFRHRMDSISKFEPIGVGVTNNLIRGIAEKMALSLPIPASSSLDVESESEMLPAPELPAELILLHILPRVPLETRREMCFVSKAFHRLLLHDVAKDILQKRLAWGAKNAKFASQEDVEIFARDAISTGKFRLVKKVEVAEHYLLFPPRLEDGATGWLLKTGLLEKCPSLRSLVCAIHSPYTLLPRLARLRSLKRLEILIAWRYDDMLDDFRSESHEEVRTSGDLSVEFLAAVARGCPNLKKVEWGFEDSYPRQTRSPDMFRKLPGALLAKVHSLETGLLDVIPELAAFPSFRPKIISQECISFISWSTLPNSNPVWSAVMKLNSLEKICLYGVTSRHLLLPGFPPQKFHELRCFWTKRAGVSCRDQAPISAQLQSLH